MADIRRFHSILSPPRAPNNIRHTSQAPGGGFRLAHQKFGADELGTLPLAEKARLRNILPFKDGAPNPLLAPSV
jgi:hypothetical protein